MLEITSMFQRNLQLPRDSEEKFLYQILNGLYKFDITTLTPTNFPIYFLENIPQYATSLCKLGNDNLFCFGIYFEDFQAAGIAFTLDLNTLQVTILPYGPKIHESGLIYYDGFVYSFGGKEQNRNGSSISELAYRFNLSANRWEKIAKMPKPNYQISCIEYESYIVVAGCWDKTIYLYDNSTDNYTSLFSFSKGTPKTLFKYNSELFLLEGAKLWKSASLYSWEIVMQYPMNDIYTVTTNVLIKENIAYFVIDLKVVAMLNFETFELNKNICWL